MLGKPWLEGWGFLSLDFRGFAIVIKYDVGLDIWSASVAFAHFTYDIFSSLLFVIFAPIINIICEIIFQVNFLTIAFLLQNDWDNLNSIFIYFCSWQVRLARGGYPSLSTKFNKGRGQPRPTSFPNKWKNNSKKYCWSLVFWFLIFETDWS